MLAANARRTGARLPARHGRARVRPTHPSAIIERVVHGGAKTWATLRARLIAKGLIYSPGHNQIDFTVPHFGDYLQREHAKKRP